MPNKRQALIDQLIKTHCALKQVDEMLYHVDGARDEHWIRGRYQDARAEYEDTCRSLRRLIRTVKEKPDTPS